jgi:ribonuclease BN (tRNA processing enzyme)
MLRGRLCRELLSTITRAAGRIQLYRPGLSPNTWRVGKRNGSSGTIYKPSEHVVEDLELASNIVDKRNKSSGTIYKPPEYVVEDLELASNIRCCLSGHNIEDHAIYTKDTGLSICFLGTSAGVPALHRSTSATLLRLGGSSFLFDAGEGVQRQMAFTRARVSHIERIFITHLHGDHIFGLPGFLLGLQHSILLKNSDKKAKNTSKPEDHVVKIYGPPGLYNFIAMNIILSCTKLHAITVEVHELVGGRVRRIHDGGRHGGGRHRSDDSARRNPFEGDYPEFNYGCIKRNLIECENGVWTIQDVPPRTREAILDGSARKHHIGKRRLNIKAAEVNHVPGVVTFGYCIQEEEPPRNIDPIRAKELGVPAGKKYELLKCGFSVQTEDGAREVKPEEVYIPRTKKARKFTLVGDNREWSPEMIEIARNSDVLVHEATLLNTDFDVSILKKCKLPYDFPLTFSFFLFVCLFQRGHSTAGMAGNMAAKIDARMLAMNHISSKADIVGEDEKCQIGDLVQAAQTAAGEKIRVVAAHDFMELLVPWMGFGEGGEEQDGPETKEEKEEDGAPDPKEVMKQWFG